jgi:hypothetical protein
MLWINAISLEPNDDRLTHVFRFGLTLSASGSIDRLRQYRWHTKLHQLFELGGVHLSSSCNQHATVITRGERASLRQGCGCCEVSGSREFRSRGYVADPIKTPDGLVLRTLRDAGEYIQALARAKQCTTRDVTPLLSRRCDSSLFPFNSHFGRNPSRIEIISSKNIRRRTAVGRN